MTKLEKDNPQIFTQDAVNTQQKAFDKHFDPIYLKRWESNITDDPIIRYAKDRRLKRGLEKLCMSTDMDLEDILHWNVLTICGGSGGEGIYLSRVGFKSVTVSDISENALAICKELAPHLHTIQLNAEAIDLEDNSFDLVVVQAGLHHLPRPTLGLTEMLRVARKTIIVLEPHTGFIPNLIGTVWEEQGDARNYVFRWNQNILEQVSRSYLLSDTIFIKAYKDWEHGDVIMKVTRRFPPKIQLFLMKSIYSFLNTFFPTFGNKFIGIVIKDNKP